MFPAPSWGVAGGELSPGTWCTGCGLWAGGSLAGSSLSFPAAGQTWPTLSRQYIGGSVTPTPTAVTGTIGADGKVDLRLDYELKIGTINGPCTLTGTTELSSRGVEKLGGQAAGKDYDPTTGRFAVASTTYPAPATSLEAGCLTVGAAYDLTAVVGWYLTGTLSLPPAPAPQPQPKPQTATVKLPKKIKHKGKTVLLKKTVLTNADQQVWTTPTWSTKKSASGHKAKYASANVSKSGKLTITTTGKAKKLYVKLVLSAPAVPGYQAYSFTKKWTVK